MNIVILIDLLFSIHNKDKMCLWYLDTILKITLLALFKTLFLISNIFFLVINVSFYYFCKVHLHVFMGKYGFKFFQVLLGIVLIFASLKKGNSTRYSILGECFSLRISHSLSRNSIKFLLRNILMKWTFLHCQFFLFSYDLESFFLSLPLRIWLKDILRQIWLNLNDDVWLSHAYVYVLFSIFLLLFDWIIYCNIWILENFIAILHFQVPLRHNNWIVCSLSHVLVCFYIFFIIFYSFTKCLVLFFSFSIQNIYFQIACFLDYWIFPFFWSVVYLGYWIL